MQQHRNSNPSNTMTVGTGKLGYKIAGYEKSGKDFSKVSAYLKRLEQDS